MQMLHQIFETIFWYNMPWSRRKSLSFQSLNIIFVFSWMLFLIFYAYCDLYFWICTKAYEFFFYLFIARLKFLNNDNNNRAKNEDLKDFNSFLFDKPISHQTTCFNFNFCQVKREVINYIRIILCTFTCMCF